MTQLTFVFDNMYW